MEGKIRSIWQMRDRSARCLSAEKLMANGEKMDEMKQRWYLMTKGGVYPVRGVALVGGVGLL